MKVDLTVHGQIVHPGDRLVVTIDQPLDPSDHGSVPEALRRAILDALPGVEVIVIAGATVTVVPPEEMTP